MRTHAGSSGYRIILAAAIALASVMPVVYARQEYSQDKQSSAHKDRAKQGRSSEQSEGEKKFKENCSRCHETPQGFSPRISGTVLRHMRVRASLSEHDEREILRFLNPQ